MFIRVKEINGKPNHYRVQIVQTYRKSGKVKQKIVRHIGIAHNEQELEKFRELAQVIKQQIENQREPKLFSPTDLDGLKAKDNGHLSVNVKDLREQERLIKGIHDIYGQLYQQVGFDEVFKGKRVTKEIIKHLVLARIASPQSKRSTQELLSRDFGVKIKLEQIYRALDSLDDKIISRIQEKTLNYTKGLFTDQINLVFYDCTTLYFESFTEDELKSFGYSKDNKFNQSQVLLALAVTEGGLPLGYELFAGNFYEGHTLKEVIESLRKRLSVNRSILVADSGLLSEENIKYLQTHGIEFIVGARLKNLPSEYKEKILDGKPQLVYEEGDDILRFLEMSYKGLRLVVSHSSKRAEKERSDRDKAIEKLKNKLSKSKDVKHLISNYGYKKYLKIKGEHQLDVDEEKVMEAAQWDGLHGILTNIKDLTSKELLEQYHGLWQVEESFRLQKHDLLIRPIYHWKPRRIKAHIALVYMSFSLLRFMQHKLKKRGINLSVEKIRKELIHAQVSIVMDRNSLKRYVIPSKPTEMLKEIYRTFNKKYDPPPYLLIT